MRYSIHPSRHSYDDDTSHKLNLCSYVIAGNSLTGSIPSGFGQLTSLQSISVGGNTITGTIPIEMGNLSQMQILSLGEYLLSNRQKISIIRMDILLIINDFLDNVKGPILSKDLFPRNLETYNN